MSALSPYDPGRPVVVTYWVAESLEVALLPAVAPEFSRLFRSLRILVDSTVGGLVTGEYVKLLGGRFSVLGLPGRPERLQRLREVMAERESCAFAVDGGGPYGVVSTGVVALAASMHAAILPVSVQGRPSTVLIHHPSRVRVPLPRHRLVVAIGDVIATSPSTERRETATMLARSLNSLKRSASAALDGVGGLP